MSASSTVSQVKEARRTLKKPQVEKFDCTQHKQTFWCYCCGCEIEKNVTDGNMTVLYGGLLEHMATWVLLIRFYSLYFVLSGTILIAFDCSDFFNFLCCFKAIHVWKSVLTHFQKTVCFFFSYKLHLNAYYLTGCVYTCCCKEEG